MKYLEKICCFFILARVFLHMCPNDKYEKYLSALIEWTAFCLFLLPFVSGELFADKWQQWEGRWQEQMSGSFEQTVKNFEEKSEKIAREAAEKAIEETKEDEETFEESEEIEGEENEVD